MLPLIVLLGALAEVKADEADAKRMMKAMSDYMAGEKAISFAYDSIFEVVTKDHQTIGLASSGTVLMRRPDKIRATRSGGFADVEMLFDGKMLTMLGKNANSLRPDRLHWINRSSNRRVEKQIRPSPACRRFADDGYLRSVDA